MAIRDNDYYLSVPACFPNQPSCDPTEGICACSCRYYFQEHLAKVEKEKEEEQKAWSQMREELEHRIVEVCVCVCVCVCFSFIQEEGDNVEFCFL